MKLRGKHIAAGIIILIIIGVAVWSKFYATGNSIDDNIVVVPLDPELHQKVVQTIVESEFLEDMPKTGIISLRFYDFAWGERRWRDGFIIRQNEELTGAPDVHFYMHTKYISQLTSDNLCEVIKEAKKDGDFEVHTKLNNMVLFYKYAKMLEHRACFGI